MKLLKKTRLYSIVTDKEANFKVQNFADEHSAKNSKVYVQSDGEIIMIDFYSKQQQENIVEELREALESEFVIRVGEQFIYVTKK